MYINFRIIINNMIKKLPDNITLNEILNDDKAKLVYFGASWCLPCKKLYPDIEKLSLNTPNVDFYKGDIDKCENIVNELGITSIPLTFLIKNKKIIHRTIGANFNEIQNEIKNLA